MTDGHDRVAEGEEELIEEGSLPIHPEEKKQIIMGSSSSSQTTIDD